MNLMTKQEAAQWLGCEVADVDAIMGTYGIRPMGGKNGRGGGYLPLLAPAVAEFEAKKAALEGELRQLIHDALEDAERGSGNLTLLVHSIASELRQSTAPQDFAGAFQQFALELDSRR